MDERLMQECVDKMAIKELCARYSIAFDTGDAEGYAALFTEDGTIELGGQKIVGRAAIRDFASSIYGGVPDPQHVQSNHVIDVTGDKARSKCELTAFLSRPDGVHTVCTGFYEDNLLRVDGHWMFSYRNIIVLNPESQSVRKVGEYLGRATVLNPE